MNEDKELTRKDVDILIDCVDIYSSLDDMTLQTHAMLRESYKQSEEQLTEFDKATKDKIKELTASSKMKKYQGILLKYKLVKLKESIDADILLQGLKND